MVSQQSAPSPLTNYTKNMITAAICSMCYNIATQINKVKTHPSNSKTQSKKAFKIDQKVKIYRYLVSVKQTSCV